MTKQLNALPPKEWPLTARQCQRPESKKVFEVVSAIDSVKTWINDAGRDDAARDRRACSLVSVLGDFCANAQQQKLSKPEHRNYYKALAKELNACAKSLRGGPPSRIWREFTAQVEMRAKLAQSLAEHPDMAGRAQGKNAQRNEFARQLSMWVSQCEGEFKHSM